ncbi:uncharacterized protein G2W53_026594 [Senna tora]|uniref:Uncharacterized protein n=1 Tax=Senna tora TaxID=362788 RepID=A0A834THF9_9FABA|nr:uncharacterized protein G2W53_026594 [Senna tora]
MVEEKQQRIRELEARVRALEARTDRSRVFQIMELNTRNLKEQLEDLQTKLAESQLRKGHKNRDEAMKTLLENQEEGVKFSKGKAITMVAVSEESMAFRPTTATSRCYKGSSSQGEERQN